MPNTLIHIAIQAPLSRSLKPGVELPWILLGVIIPDIPWILQRLLPLADIVAPYQMRLYFTIQASLLFCLLLSLAAASLAKKPVLIFFMLAGNSLAHLLLDALQIKWGNGVHLLAPFSWQATSLGFVWPEHYVGYIASAAGLAYLLYIFSCVYHEGIAFGSAPSWKRALICLLVYLLMPFSLMGSLERSDSNYIQTLGKEENRIGQAVEIDRPYFSREDSTIALFDGKTIQVSGVLPEKSGTVSIRGIFTGAHALESHGYHFHNNYRDYASILGLSISLSIWLLLLSMKLIAAQRERKHK